MDLLQDFVNYCLNNGMGGLALLLGACVAALVVLLLIGSGIAWSIARRQRAVRRAMIRSGR